MKYRFIRRHDGTCSTYYKGDKGRWYCLMEDGHRGQSQVRFFVCTKDGEPSNSIPMPDPSEFDKIEMPANPWGIPPALVPVGEKASY